MSIAKNAGRALVRGLTLSAIAVSVLVAAQSDAQVVCEKANKNGKAKFKIRQECKIDRGETQIADFGELVQRNETDGLAEQLAEEIAGEIDSLQNQLDVMPRTRILRGDTFAATVGTALEPVGSVLEFETSALSTNVAITVDADCDISAPLAGETLQIDIAVDGAVVLPTDGVNDTFCSAIQGELFLTSNPGSRTVVVEDLAPGVHTVALSASMSGGAAFFTDGSLTVIISENEELVD